MKPRDSGISCGATTCCSVRSFGKASVDELKREGTNPRHWEAGTPSPMARAEGPKCSRCEKQTRCPDQISGAAFHPPPLSWTVYVREDYQRWPRPKWPLSLESCMSCLRAK